MPYLKTEGLTKQFNGFTAIDDVAISIDETEIHGLIGPNGAGKTTLFGLLTGEHHPTAGTIRFRGQDITDKAIYERAHLGIGRSYQINNFFSDMSVYENIQTAVGVYMENYYNMVRAIERLSDVEEHVTDILETVGLSKHREVTANSLSYGDKRRLEIGMAIACRPDLLLLDEPTAGMDMSESANTIELIERLNQDMSVLLVEHDVEMIMETVDVLNVLHRGQVIARGSPREIQEDELVRDVYLGGRVDA